MGKYDDKLCKHLDCMMPDILQSMYDSLYPDEPKKCISVLEFCQRRLLEVSEEEEYSLKGRPPQSFSVKETRREIHQRLNQHLRKEKCSHG